MKILKYIFSITIISVILISCDAERADQNVAGVIDESAKPIVTFTVSAQSALEMDSEEIIVDISMDKPINTATTFTIQQVGGDAVLDEDYEVSGGVIQPYEKEGQIKISVIKDLEVEGNETIDLLIGAVDTPDLYEVLNGSTNVSITIEDYVFCLWTLEAFDAFGDGWNGGFITVDSDGVSTNYSADGLSSSFSIDIRRGADYTISYTSGTPGGGAGAPGYEEENTYILTGPDGSIYADGPIPTQGVIVSGVCNM